jgi:hypothetical protein
VGGRRLQIDHAVDGVLDLVAAGAADVDTSIRSRKEWAQLYAGSAGKRDQAASCESRSGRPGSRRILGN